MSLLEPAFNAHIDFRFDSYKGFFDHQWARTIGEASDSIKLREPVFELIRDWKGVSATASMPWLMIESLKAMYAGFRQVNPPFSHQLLKSFQDYFLSDRKFSDARRKELIQKTDEFAEKIQKDLASHEPLFNVNEVWKEYLAIPQFVLTLWSSQRMAYCALYYSYEIFLQHCVAKSMGDSDYRAPNLSKLEVDFATQFGKTMSKNCISDPVIVTARLARHCLIHNGGRVSQKLLDASPKLQINDDVIHVLPEDSRALFDFLRVKAAELVEFSRNDPKLLL